MCVGGGVGYGEDGGVQVREASQYIEQKDTVYSYAAAPRELY